jgi:hypothetical protein
MEIQKCFNGSFPYIRIGTEYYKLIIKSDRFEIPRIELKNWKKEEIRQDHGKKSLETISKFDDFTIKPDNLNYSPVIDNCYNLYQPFSHKPNPGTWPWTKRLLEHIFGDQYELGLRYLQILYQHPERLMPILVLFSKIRQTGKTTTINWINMIFGENVANISSEDLSNGFNSSYACSNIITVEETLIEKSVTIEKLKALATAKYITVNQKFIRQYRTPFYGKIILTTNNEEKFAKIDDEEIRFFIRKLGKPEYKNHNIEKDLQEEIPAFLNYLTTLPPIDWTQDRSGFTPFELENDFLRSVKEESKSWLYKTLMMRFEELFMNELAKEELFYADPVSIKERFFSQDTRVTLPYIRSVLKEELHLKPSQVPEYHIPFEGSGSKKMARFYEFRRDQYTDQAISTETPTPF